MYPLIFLFISILSILIHLFFMKKPRTLKKIIEISFLYMIVINLAFSGILAFYGHVFMGPEIAKKIGWAPGSPFQFEVGVADLAFGITALLCIWIRGTYWIAAALANSIFLFGAAFGHIRDMIMKGNFSVYNSGYVLWVSDMLLPALILGLAITNHVVASKKKPIKKKKKKTKKK